MNNKQTKKVLIVLGTRPEATKLAPIIKRLRNEPNIKTTVCVFRQHKRMLDQNLKALDIQPDLDLPIALSDRTLSNGNIIKKGITILKSGIGLLKYVRFLKKERPDLLIIQGDTSTGYLAAWLAFHIKIPIAHVEAGLRTHNKYSPFPEEMNRVLISRLADIHFAPTELAQDNLLKEGIEEKAIHVVGNTAIDALLEMKKNLKPDMSAITLDSNKKMILVTAHRRESFGEGLKQICEALKEIISNNENIEIVYPVHANPNVTQTVKEALKDIKNIHLIEPVAYDEMVYLMSKAYIILTDSGGIQEEAPSLDKPVLVMREETERTEGLNAGTSKLVGVEKRRIVQTVEELLTDEQSYNEMAEAKNPYGDGHASERIVTKILEFLLS